MKKLTSVCFITLITLLILLSIACCACSRKEPQPVSSSEMLLDTVCTITLYQPADQELLDKALKRVAEYEDLFSPSIPGSDIYRLNHAQGEPVSISAEAAEMLRLGLDYGQLSQGLLDLTIGRVSQLWDFGGANHVPEEEELQEALSTVDYRQLELSGSEESGYTACLHDPESQIEPGAIAKGYIADRIAAFLRENGVERALIDLGGNILTLGGKSSGEPWIIGVETPFSDRTSIIGAVAVDEASVVTSGIYERQFIRDGQLYHHILDPQTGFPVESGVVSVTIVSHSSAIGDCLSTLALLLGQEAGSDFLQRQPDVMGAIWVDQEGEIYVQGDIDFQKADQQSMN